MAGTDGRRRAVPGDGLRLFLTVLRTRSLPSLARWSAAQRAAAPGAATGAAEGVPKRSRDLFARGGKLFETRADDGSGRAISTLLQADGDLVTRATADSIADAELAARHEAEIVAWLHQLNRDWQKIENWWSGGLGAAALVLTGVDAATVASTGPAWHLAYLMVPAAAVAACRAGVSVVVRRSLRHV